MTSDLKSKHCQACDAKTPKLGEAEAHSLLRELDGWQLGEGASSIARTFNFKNYYQTMAFVNAVAYMAHREDHHPDLTVSYNRCIVVYSTHAVGGLSENDFICAAKVDALVAG
jgi:4a-hydroxytetrahydrobiopterin dehydratase